MTTQTLQHQEMVGHQGQEGHFMKRKLKSLESTSTYLALLAFSDLNENNTLYYDCIGSILNKWYILTSTSCVFSSKKPLRYEKQNKTKDWALVQTAA